MREVLLARIERWGFNVRAAENVQEARHQVATFDPHVVVSDLVMPDATGMDLLRVLRGADDQRVVLLLTAYGTIDTAVQAIKLGATDFMTKPLDYVALRRHLDRVRETLESKGDPRSEFELPDREASATGGMVGASPALTTMIERVRMAATSDAPVLVVGESGTGKELVARTIHALSTRATRAFVPVNAAAVPESLVEGEFFGFDRGAFTGANEARPGLFEQADQGTLFLDEFTEMPATLQSKFLRVLEDGRVRRLGARTERSCDVRVIAATNRDPTQAVSEGRLRADVLYRIDVLRIVVPPLRERKADIPPLVAHFIRDCEQRYRVEGAGVSTAAIEQLVAHDWPGNVRELRNVVERAFVAAHQGLIDVEHLGLDAELSSSADEEPSLGIVIPYGVSAAEAERILILETLKRTGNNKAETARRLQLDVKTIRNKLKQFGARERQNSDKPV